MPAFVDAGRRPHRRHGRAGAVDCPFHSAVQNIIVRSQRALTWEHSHQPRARILTALLVVFSRRPPQIKVLALGALIFGYRPTGSLVARRTLVRRPVGAPALALWSRSRDAALSPVDQCMLRLESAVSPRFPIGFSTSP